MLTEWLASLSAGLPRVGWLSAGRPRQRTAGVLDLPGHRDPHGGRRGWCRCLAAADVVAVVGRGGAGGTAQRPRRADQRAAPGPRRLPPDRRARGARGHDVPARASTCARCTWSSRPGSTRRCRSREPRARGQLVEVRAVDLRFTTEESAAYLNQPWDSVSAENEVAGSGRTHRGMDRRPAAGRPVHAGPS